MDYSDSFDQANEYLRIAIPLINKHGVAPNPLNYAVWYAYASGQNLKLSNAIDKIIAAKGKLTEEISLELYKSYIENHDAIAAQVQNSVDKVMNALSDQLTASTNQAEHYGQLLGSVDKQIGASSGSGDLQDVVKNLSQETQIIKDVNSDLTEELVNSSNELEQLKIELEEVRKTGLKILNTPCI